MFQILPILFGAGVAAGLYGLTWYDSLTPEGKKQADRMAADLAMRLYDKAVDQLTHEQMRYIGSRIQQSLGL